MQLRTLEAAVQIWSPPTAVFDAWISPVTHTALSGHPAFVDARVGGRFQLWGGSVKGEFVHLARPHVVAQTWRTDDFTAQMEDSRLEVSFKPVGAGTRLQVVHAWIPASLYDQFVFGWTQFILPRFRELVLPN